MADLSAGAAGETFDEDAAERLNIETSKTNGIKTLSFILRGCCFIEFSFDLRHFLALLTNVKNTGKTFPIHSRAV